MDTMGCGDMTALISCEHADLAIACECEPRPRAELVEARRSSPWLLSLRLLASAYGPGGPFKPEHYFIIPHRSHRATGKITEREEHHVPVKGNTGMAYEADEVFKCVARGQLESARMPWDESRIVQGWFDGVRNAGGSALKGLKGTVGQ
jgi:hypothetical protein